MSPGRETHVEVLCRVAAYSASLLVAAPFLYHLAHGSTAFLGLLEDDYFYYATIADHLVTAGKLSYDGGTLTNGFHPLWFGVIALLRLVFGRFGSAYYVALTAISVAAMFATYELGRRFARSLGASPVAAAVICTIYSVSTGRLLADGMECIIAVPLYMWLLIEMARPLALTPRRAALIGCIASLAILARLDIAIAVGMAIIGYFAIVRPTAARGLRLLAAFGAGGILVPLYAAANYAAFGSLLPVSAVAKRLQTSTGFSLNYARYAAIGTDFGPTMAIVLPLGLLALGLIVRSGRREQAAGRFVGGLTLLFAFFFFGLNALSGWIFFGWYEYPLPAAVIAALVFINARWLPLRPGATRNVVLAAALIGVSPLLALGYFFEHGPRWSISDNSLLHMSYDLAEHTRGREGLYSMGAIAGMAAYVMDKPVLQLEGIVADRRMVEHVRRQDPLDQVLREYHADYLIVSVAGIPLEKDDGCYLVTEPHQQWAGRRTAKMRGALCSEPMEHFFTEAGVHAWSIFPRIETFVWDLRTARWRN